jgi:quinol-cytochrome oxidoreductase complex cytochrome b subunit
MRKTYKKFCEYALLALATFSAFLLTDFGGYWMPSAALMWAATLVVVAGIAIGALFFFDRVHDEREEAIRNRATRAAYGVGLAVLLAGVSYRALAHVPADPWLLAAIVAMTGALVILRNRNLDA